MKKVTLTFLILLFLMSCSNYTYFYNFEVKKCFRNINNDELGKLNYSSKSLEKYHLINISDNIIDINLIPNLYGFEIEIKNKSKLNIEIVWDKSVIVNRKGESSRIILGDTKINDVGNNQVNSLLIKGSKCSKEIFSQNSIFYYDGSTKKWDVNALFRNLGTSFSKDKLIEKSKKSIGDLSVLFLTINYDNQLLEYTVEININDIKTIQNKIIF